MINQHFSCEKPRQCCSWPHRKVRHNMCRGLSGWSTDECEKRIRLTCVYHHFLTVLIATCAIFFNVICIDGSNAYPLPLVVLGNSALHRVDKSQRTLQLVSVFSTKQSSPHAGGCQQLHIRRLVSDLEKAEFASHGFCEQFSCQQRRLQCGVQLCRDRSHTGFGDFVFAFMLSVTGDGFVAFSKSSASLFAVM